MPAVILPPELIEQKFDEIQNIYFNTDYPHVFVNKRSCMMLYPKSDARPGYMMLEAEPGPGTRDTCSRNQLT